jgi:hypothetical protein
MLERNLWQAVAVITWVTVALIVVICWAATNGVIVFRGTGVEITLITLAAATITLTGVAILAAVGTIWGYAGLRESVIDSASKRAAEIANATAEARVNDLVPRLVEARLLQERPDVDENFAAAFPRVEQKGKPGEPK